MPHDYCLLTQARIKTKAIDDIVGLLGSRLSHGQLKLAIDLKAKGWLFMDSPSGGIASAAFYSLLQTAQLNGQDPVKYLIHVFDQIAACPGNTDFEDLLPYLLKQAD